MAALAAGERIDDETPQIERARIERRALGAAPAQRDRRSLREPPVIPLRLPQMGERGTGRAWRRPCRAAAAAPGNARRGSRPARGAASGREDTRSKGSWSSAAHRAGGRHRAGARSSVCREDVGGAEDKTVSLLRCQLHSGVEDEVAGYFHGIVPAEIFEVEEDDGPISPHQRVVEPEIGRAEPAPLRIDRHIEGDPRPRIGRLRLRYRRFEGAPEAAQERRQLGVGVGDAGQRRRAPLDLGDQLAGAQARFGGGRQARASGVPRTRSSAPSSASAAASASRSAAGGSPSIHSWRAQPAVASAAIGRGTQVMP